VGRVGVAAAGVEAAGVVGVSAVGVSVIAHCRAQYGQCVSTGFTVMPFGRTR